MLSQKLKQLRQSKGMTLQQVADQLAVTRASVSKWECAKSQPDMSRIQAIAELFGVSSHYLLGLSTSPTLKDYPVIELKFGVSLDFLIDYYSDLERYPSNLPVADTAFFAPEAEFFVFDSARFKTSANESMYHVDSIEGAWNSGNEFNADGSDNRGYKTRIKGGYFPVSPTDQMADLRDQMVVRLAEVGLLVERSHHEVGTAGQMEINYRFNTLLKAADEVMLFKYVIRNTAWEGGKTATFMPKPLFGDNGSGMHVHQSLWTKGSPLFYDERGYGGLSDLARWYIGGILKHAPSLLAFTNPTVNSYHRLVPGYEAPVNLVYSQRNRSACLRIPVTGSNPKAKRIEFRCPDPSSNPYLAFAAMLMAGLDGIKNKIEPHAPVDKDLYELPPEEAADIPQVPSSLPEVLEALEADHDYLLEGGVFTKDLIETWIEYKRTAEIDYVRLRPHPAEFELYYDL